jgi:hypothetical protein
MIKIYGNNVYEMGPGTKWESFEDVLIRHAKEKYNIELTKEQASKYHSIMQFDKENGWK